MANATDLQRKIDVIQQGIRENRIEDLLAQAWRLIRRLNPDLSPVGFAQAAQSVAEREEEANRA